MFPSLSVADGGDISCIYLHTSHRFVSGVEVDGHAVDRHPEDAQHGEVAAAHDEHLNIILSRSWFD